MVTQSTESTDWNTWGLTEIGEPVGTPESLYILWLSTFGILVGFMTVGAGTFSDFFPCSWYLFPLTELPHPVGT